MKFTQIPANTFQTMQLNAGVLTKSFDPETGELAREAIVGATTGGTSFSAVPSFSDFGEDVDNCPANTKELKRLDSWEVKLTGTYVTFNEAVLRDLAGAADVTGGKLTPRNDLADADFGDYWWVGDYGDKDGGFVAIKLINALSTGGLSLQSTDNGKGQWSFELTGHYSIEDPDKVPFEVYVKAAK